MKKRWTNRASNLRHQAVRQMIRLCTTLHKLEKEIEGRPASYAEGFTELFIEAPKQVSSIKRKLNRFYLTHMD